MFCSFCLVSFRVISGTSSHHSIWIVGDSLIHWVSVYTERLGCPDLGLQATVSWWGKRGLNLRECSHLLRDIAHQQPSSPAILLVHVGSNDVGMVNKKHLMEMILSLIKTVHSLLPQTTLVWWDIIPRVSYDGVPRQGQSKVDKTRRAANKNARSQTVRRGGPRIATSWALDWIITTYVITQGLCTLWYNRVFLLILGWHCWNIAIHNWYVPWRLYFH